MERTKKHFGPQQELFMKTGKGTLRLKDGKVVKGGETFWAFPEDIPSAFRDTIHPVAGDKKEEFKEHGTVSNNTPSYTKQKREGENPKKDQVELWDILDRRGKVVNEDGVPEEEADQLLKALNAK